MIYGLDYLGGAKYRSVVLDEHPMGWAAGFFAQTFGDAYPVIDALLATGRCPLVRIHLLWSDTHTFGDKDIPAIRGLSTKYNELARKYRNVKVEISPCCEHNLKESDKYLDIVKIHAPDCTPVNTPWNGALSKKYKNEVHGSKKDAPRGAYNYSYDGQSAVDADVSKHKKKYSSSEVFFWWVPQFNLRKNTNDKTPRPERKAVPTNQLVDSVIYLKNDKGKTELPDKFLWKSHADQHDAPVPEPRALKPVLICPVKAERFELVAANGQVILASSKAQPFSDSRYRYYFNDFGYQIAEKAIRIQGNAVCKLRANGKIYGKVNAAFRENDYR